MSSVESAVGTPGDAPDDDRPSAGRIVLRTLLLVAIAAFAAFWIWALFFASKEAVNRIDDRAWAERAERICAEVDEQLDELAMQTSTDLDVRAGLVVTSTDLLASMLDDIEADPPADEKGQAIVPQWIADYRTLLDDRYRYAEQLRTGVDGPFTETAVDGIPITERIETFAGDNEIPSCAPPRGSVL